MYIQFNLLYIVVKCLLSSVSFVNAQLSPFIMLFRSIGIGFVVNDPCYKGTILQKNYRKMTISWAFSYNSFVKLHGKKIWESQHDHVISKSML